MSSIDTRNAAFLSAIEHLQARSDRAQNQISTGFRVNSVSDDPSSVSDILSLQMRLAHSTQVEQNLSTVKAQVDTADSVISKGVSLLERAITIGANGATATATAEGRRSMADEVKSLMEQMVGLSRTDVAGTYIFSGDNSTQPAYELDLTQATGVNRLFVAGATQQIQDVSGSTFSPGLTAQDIFDSRNPDDTVATDNVFAALNQLRLALGSNNVTDVNAAIGSLKKAHDSMGQHLAFYGAVQNRISSAIAVAQTYQLNQQSELGNKRDADIAAAILDLTQARNNLQAAMQAQAARFSGSLFDFLK